MGIEAFFLDEALCKTERHGGVIRPLAGLQVERTPSLHIGHRVERAPGQELDRGTQGVAHSKPEETSLIAFENVHIFLPPVPPLPPYLGESRVPGKASGGKPPDTLPKIVSKRPYPPRKVIII